MSALDGTITSADVCAALDQEFVENFTNEYDRFEEILGIFPAETRQAGAALYQYKITGSLKDDKDGNKGSSGTQYVEGDTILRSHYTVEKDLVGEIDFAPYAKQTTAKAILTGGFENAVSRTDKKAHQQLRSAIMDSFFTFLGNGTGVTDEQATLKAALAHISADLEDKLEDNDDEAGDVVYFVNRQDIASYLASAEITTQTLFGMTYLESFLGVDNIIVTNKVAQGTIYATPVENIRVYGLDFAALGEAGLSYASDSLGLIGVHHVGDYDRASSETYLVKGCNFLPEIKDYIFKGTIAGAESE